MSRTSSNSSSVNEINYYCHRCNQFVTRLYSQIKCHLCRTGFIEEVDLNNSQSINNLLEIESNDSESEYESNPSTDSTNDNVFQERDLEEEEEEDDDDDDDEEEEESEPQTSSTPIIQIRIQRNRSANSPIDLVGFNVFSDNVILNVGQFLTRFFGAASGSGSGPLDQTSIDRIPNAIVSDVQVSDGMLCTVCMEKFRVEEVVRKLVCDHYFHYDCIHPWLSLHSNCPICRRDLSDS